MNVTRDLAEFVTKTNYSDLSESAIDAAKKLTLDTLGSILYSSKMEWSRKVVSLVRRIGAQGNSTVIPFGFKTAPSAAGLANGTMGHGFELDDVHEGAMIHPGAVVIPAALAIGEQESVEGKEFLLAVIVGYEAMSRIGMGVGAKYHILRGFHPTGTNGFFGAAVAAGKVIGLGTEQIVDALGISGSFCSGLMQFSQETSAAGEMIKRLHAGRASEGGIIAALLAKEGFRGPSDIIGGKFGFCNVYSDHPDIRVVQEKLGLGFEILNVGIKPYPCCQTLHSVIDAVASLMNEHLLKVDEIKEIKVGGSEKLVSYHSIYKIDSIMAAQFSAPFCVALTIAGDIKDPGKFDKKSAQVGTIEKLMKITTLFRDEDLEKVFPSITGAKVIVSLNDGNKFEKTIMYAKGSPHNEMTYEDVCEKFTLLAREIIKEREIGRVIELVNNLESVSNITEMVEPLVAHQGC